LDGTIIFVPDCTLCRFGACLLIVAGGRALAEEEGEEKRRWDHTRIAPRAYGVREVNVGANGFWSKYSALHNCGSNLGRHSTAQRGWERSPYVRH